MISALPVEARVISLERTPHRLEQFRARFGPLADSVVWQPGVDGAQLHLEQLQADGVLSSDALQWPRGQIGCALSHLTCWRQCCAQQRPLLIFEDDVVVPGDWSLRLRSLLDQLDGEPWDLLLLGWNQDSCLQLEWAPNLRFTALFRPRYPSVEQLQSALEKVDAPRWFRLITALGLAGYLVSPEGAKRLLELVLPLRKFPIVTPELPERECFSLDGQMNHFYADLKAYACFPPLAVGANHQAESLTQH